MWSLAGIPHMMVPNQRSLVPSMTFQAQAHSQDMAIAAVSQAEAPYPTYVPALTRAGWYKSLFIELLCEPEGLQAMLSVFCAETYKPGVLNQPDIQKQDKTETPGLGARANAMRTAAVSR